MKKRIVVIAPGRGSYTKETLGYLQNRLEVRDDLQIMDLLKKELGEPTISELDQAATFRTSVHTKGENASPLIYACALADFLSIDQEQYEIVAVTGNSMGWYLALAFGGALTTEKAFQLINTMGSMMKGGLVGGQIIYPIVNKDWQLDEQAQEEVLQLIDEVHSLENHEAYVSIRLGGYLVIGGNNQGLSILSKKLKPIDHYPFQLINHGAFHTPMCQEISLKAFQQLPSSLFNKPNIPLIDGRGHIWQPYSTQIKDLYEYTLSHQVVKPYDFSKAISVSLKEFAPDHIVLLGPGNSLGGAIGQIMIKHGWKGVQNKNDFTQLQNNHPFLISMGMQLQKKLMTRSASPANSI